MTDLASLYRFRFNEAQLPGKMKIWRVLCREFFQRLIDPSSTVLDVACGYGEFINNIEAKSKHAIDLNPDTKGFLNKDIAFHQTRADQMVGVESGSIDVVFTSNFLEHLESKSACDAVLQEVHRVLRPGGKFIVMGPNIRYLAGEYWDFYDHHLPLSHASLEEGLSINGFHVIRNIPRFLPYTTRSALPQHPLLVSAYLKVPLAWPILGRQFLLVAEKPA
ncbi:class I SAM-dependent methyltransferase [Dyella psychrodurans]|uniref:Class I SAM-dependent methyltransferase n=1 Tax=Dyella psychrodurans TaxID=1927960 RepID=A0A370X566_9GAMM|nr:class I SAM-dependent methyltransferase [Dyella psychrodurans]RDS83410.1 class I SAM-dependent methyltransferase [Dyella psychrodurans]